MRRVLLIARRDYLQIIQSKAYLVALIVLPLLMGASFLAVPLMNRNNRGDQRIAVIDHTGVAAASIIQACQESNRKALATTELGARVGPHFVFEEIKPEADQSKQILTLSDRIRKGELFLVLDIPAGQEPVRYYTNSSVLNQGGISLPGAVNDGLRRVRLSQAGLDSARIPDLLREVPLVSMNLATRDPASGRIVQGEKRNPLQAGFVALFLVTLMIMVVLVGSAPQLSAVAEDKMQRVFEMLLCSASPFELMFGKVLAAVGASLTSSIFYIIGGLFVLYSMAMFGLAPIHLLPWFFLYLIAEVFMLAALGVALGSACSTPQDAQHLAFLLFLPIFIPMFLLSAILQQPNGGLAHHALLRPAFYAGADVAASGAARRGPLVAPLFRITRNVRVGRRSGVGGGANLPNRHSVPRQSAQTHGIGAVGCARGLRPSQV
jgi:ABC-2 type transport system permease protein